MNKITVAVLAAFMTGCNPTKTEAETPAAETHAVTIMTFNVENLFDNKDDVGKVDETFFALSDKQSEEHKKGCAEIQVERWRDQCLNWDWNDAVIEKKLAIIAELDANPTFEADLDEFISTTDCLSAYRGSIVTRNNCSTSWTNVFSVRLAQEIKVGSMAFDLMLDIENFGNLLNSDWGRVESYTAPSVLVPANVSIPVAGGPYLLAPTSSYAGSASTVVSPPEIAKLPSVYRIQFGVRFRF